MYGDAAFVASVYEPSRVAVWFPVTWAAIRYTAKSVAAPGVMNTYPFRDPAAAGIAEEKVTVMELLATATESGPVMPRMSVTPFVILGTVFTTVRFSRKLQSYLLQTSR